MTKTGEPQQPITFSKQFTQEIEKYIQITPKPTVKGFANSIGVTEDTLYAWANKKRKDAQGNVTDQLARPNFHSTLQKLVDSKPRQQDYPNLLKGNIGNNGGRPTKYDPKYASELIEFFETKPNYLQELPHFKDGQTRWVDYKKLTNKLPTFLDFAKKIGVNGDTIVEWSKQYAEFTAAYIRAKELQKYFIIENGLNGLYNPQFAIFVAKNITDMKDKQEVDHTTNGKDLPTPIYGSKSTT